MSKWFFVNLTLIACFTMVKLSSEENISHCIAKNINHGSQSYDKKTVEEIRVNGFHRTR